MLVCTLRYLFGGVNLLDTDPTTGYPCCTEDVQRNGQGPSQPIDKILQAQRAPCKSSGWDEGRAISGLCAEAHRNIRRASIPIETPTPYVHHFGSYTVDHRSYAKPSCILKLTAGEFQPLPSWPKGECRVGNIEQIRDLNILSPFSLHILEFKAVTITVR
jgi:hypothetical protein